MSSKRIPFAFLSAVSIVAGILFIFLFYQIGSHIPEQRRENYLFGLAAFFASITNAAAFRMLHLLQDAGFSTGLWRSPVKDFRLYREYWNLAPSRGWSRVTPIAMLLSMLMAFVLIASIVILS